MAKARKGGKKKLKARKQSVKGPECLEDRERQGGREAGQGRLTRETP
jgi:hypothetical protein